jgi:hypothetical protein
MFSSSSNAARIINSDGSTNVFCYSCGQFIARTFHRVNRSLCVVCKKIEDGEMVPEEALRQYDESKLGKANVSLLSLSVELPANVKKFTFSSMTGEFMRAFSFKKKEKPDAPKSKATARGRRRAPLFSNLQLGSMNDIDEKLRGDDDVSGR